MVLAILLNNCAFSLSRPLWLLFNKSLSTGIVPELWKTPYVVPIYENEGRKGAIQNYRPISLMSLIPNLLDSIISDFFNDIFRNIIISQQHSFSEGRSITTNLLVYHEYITSLEYGHVVGSICTDI